MKSKHLGGLDTPCFEYRCARCHVYLFECPCYGVGKKEIVYKQCCRTCEEIIAKERKEQE